MALRIELAKPEVGRRSAPGVGRRSGRHGRGRRRVCPSILLPILLQTLGGLLAFAWAGDVLEPGTERATGDRSSVDRGAPSDGEAPDGAGTPRDSSDEKPQKVPPAGTSGAGGVPAGVKLAAGTSGENWRGCGASRVAAHGMLITAPGASCARTRQATILYVPGSSPVGGRLSPFSPRGPPARA